MKLKLSKSLLIEMIKEVLEETRSQIIIDGIKFNVYYMDGGFMFLAQSEKELDKLIDLKQKNDLGELQIKMARYIFSKIGLKVVPDRNKDANGFVFKFDNDYIIRKLK